MLKIQEFCYGLQGEGIQMGYPSVFIRLGGCNLSCKGFACKIDSPLDGSELTGCDTIYAANSKHFKHTWEEWEDWKELVNEIEGWFPIELLYTKEKIDIVFTGGEPLIYHKDPILINTVEHFISRGHNVWFETNGTIDIDFNKFSIYKKCNFSMSVKMKLSGEEESKRWKPEIVNNYIKNTKNSYFKFVMSKNNIHAEKKEIFTFLFKVPYYAPVYCMPLGGKQEELIKNGKAVYEFATENGFRYSDRLHIRIHDDKMGV